MNIITLSELVHGDSDTTPAPIWDPRKAESATMLSGTDESRETPKRRESSSRGSKSRRIGPGAMLLVGKV